MSNSSIPPVPNVPCVPKFHAYVGKDVGWLLRSQARQRGAKRFLFWETFHGRVGIWTYAEFLEACEAFGAGLLRLGLKRGDTIVLHMNNSPEFLITLFAGALTGIVVVTTNTRYSAAELDYAVGHCGARTLVTGADLVEVAARLDSPIDRLIVSSEWLCASKPAIEHLDWAEIACAEPLPELPADPMRNLSVQYTSGTTGRPKGVLFTHANALWCGHSVSRNFLLREDDIAMTVFPLYHLNAMGYSVFGTLWSGGMVVLHPRFSASRYWELVTRADCTWSSVTGFVAKALAAQPVPEHSLRFWPIGVGDHEPIERHFGVKLIGMWGMTETISHGIASFPHLEGRDGAIGMVSPDYEITLRDDEGRELAPSEEGTRGNLYIRGIPGLTLFKEYLNNPEATAASFDEQGWFETGDVVTAYADGSMVFNDRSKDMLRVGAENVAASEIERVIGAVPGVREVAVVAKKDPMLEEVPVAFVLSSDSDRDALTEAIERACGEQLADFKRPRQIVHLDEFPRSTLDKVAKKDLRKLLEDD